MKVILTLLISVLLTACSMQQDPLSGAPVGVPPTAQKPLPEDPISKDALQIDSPLTEEVRVGARLDFKIFGRVMDPQILFEISIDNLSDFPGATFDTATGEFAWTPEKAFVQGKNFVEAYLYVTLTTTPSAKYPVVSREQKKITIVVVNSFNTPVIKAFTGPSEMFIGQSYTMPFAVEDFDAVSKKDITILPSDCSSAYYKSISYLAKAKDTIRVDPTSPGRFTGEIVVDLTSAHGLSRGNYCVGFVVVSKYGSVSNISNRTFTVQPQLKHTVMSLDDMPIIKAGETAQIYFTIYDPSGLGQVEIQSIDDIATILPGSSFNCASKSYRLFQLDCGVVVNTSQVKPGRYNVLMKVKNFHVQTGKQFIDNHAFRVIVE